MEGAPFKVPQNTLLVQACINSIVVRAVVNDNLKVKFILKEQYIPRSLDKRKHCVDIWDPRPGQ